MVIKIMDMRKIPNQIRVVENYNTVQADFKSFKDYNCFCRFNDPKGLTKETKN
jgi:hypothetical protein